MSSRKDEDTRKPSGPQGPDTPRHSDDQPDSNPESSTTESSTPDPRPGNAFSEAFLEAFGRRDQPPTTEADTAGPWFIEPREHGWVVYAQSAEEAEAVLTEWELALLCAAALPASGADERLYLADTGERPFPLEMAGERVGSLRWFREDLLSAMNHLLTLLRRPDSLAYLLEAAGSITLERAGEILARRLDGIKP